MARDLDKIAQRIASSGQIRTAGKIEFVKDTGPIRRDIRVDGFQWSPESLRNLAKILWAAQRSQSYAMAAFRLFAKMPSSEFSPDGLLGGRGYIQSIKDMRTGMSQAVESLSSFTDTVHDEINANHWNLEADPSADKIVEKAEEVKANPEGFVQQEFAEEDHENGGFANPSPDEMNPFVNQPQGEGEEVEGEESQSQYASTVKKRKRPKVSESQLPKDKLPQKEGKTLAEETMHTVTPDRGSYAASIDRIVKNMAIREASSRQADSSLPVDTLPGPRVDHIGPAAGNEAGHFNDEDVWPSDDPTGEGLFSGTNMSNPLLEGEDAEADGVTGYDNPTDGDSSNLKHAAERIANYSWLPGSKNEKNFNYYELGLSAEDIEWMREHNEPDPPKDMVPKKPRPQLDLWDENVVR
jgi:hypothetical protein